MKIERVDLAARLNEMRKQGYTYLVGITAVDYVNHLEIIYFVRDLAKNTEDSINVDLDPSDAWVPTITPHFKSADWYEREVGEMFGIEIRGRRTDRLLLEKWNGKAAPLRKNFNWNEPYETMID